MYGKQEEKTSQRELETDGEEKLVKIEIRVGSVESVDSSEHSMS